MSSAVVTPTEYRNLPVVQLQESPTNPRRRFDEHGLNELAASFKTQGVLQPLLVRELGPDQYEVVAGARRLRAAKLAELTEVPVRVVALSDGDCVVTQLIENIQREGVHPMEEALAFETLLRLDEPHYDITAVAAKAGKSPAFVAQRLRLVELISSVAEAFLADDIGVGHALTIAKLPQSEQQRAFDAGFRSVWGAGGETRVLLPVRDLTAWIEHNILLSLDKVPFDKADETLLPEAGSCVSCPKRTGFNTLLFGETADACTDGACFNAKLGSHVARQLTAKPNLVQISTAWNGRGEGEILGRNRYVALQLNRKPGKSKLLSPAQKPCKSMAEAIVADGSERGRVVKICADTHCRVHFPNYREPKPEDLARQREQRRKELEQRKTEATVRHRILADVLKDVDAPLERADLVLVLQSALETQQPERQMLIARRHKLVDGTAREVTYPQVQKALGRLLRQSDESGLSKLFVELVLLSEVESTGEPERLLAAAKQHKVDVAKLRKSVEQEFAAKHAKAQAKQKPKAKTVA
jgi:ParB family chromosome partitioning protein